MNDHKVSFYNSIKETTPIESKLISSIFEDIKVGRWKNEVLATRIDQSKKNELPCFTPSGIFTKRKKNNLLIFSHLICFDFDNVEHISKIRIKLSHLDWIYCNFITPSGRGLKVLVKVKSSVDKFEDLERTIASKLFEVTGMMRDTRAKGISQPQYISYDPEGYLNARALFYEEQE